MWIDDNFIVPAHVAAVVPKGKDGSRGCEVWLVSGGTIDSLLPLTQVVAMLGLVKSQ